MSSQASKDMSPTLRDPIDSLESNFKAVVDYLTSSAPSPDVEPPKEKPSDVASTSFVSKAGTMIKKHPLAASGVAFGLGYLLMRLIRR